MASTRTVLVEERPRPLSMASEMGEMRKSQFLSKTSMFLKRVTLVKSGRRKSEDKKSSTVATPRGARSMDLSPVANKPFGMSQPVLSVNPDNEDHSDSSGSPSQHDSRPTSSIHPVQPFSEVSGQRPTFPIASSSTPDCNTQSHGILGLPAVALGPTQVALDGIPRPEHSTNPFRSRYMPPKKDITPSNGVTPSKSEVSNVTESTSRSSSDTFHSAHEDVSSESSSGPSPAVTALTPPMTYGSFTPLQQYTAMDASTFQARSQSLPSRSIIVTGTGTPITNANTPTPTSPQFTIPADGSTPKPIHPRLASLPPPMMARYATQGSVRLTPSIAPRPTPILTLPPLPPMTPVPQPTAAQIGSPMRLRSMPALPMRGPGEGHAAGADHGNAALDEMDEMVEEEDEEEESMSEHAAHASEDEGDSESSPTTEGPSMGRRVRPPLPPSLSRSPRLPGIDTSRLDIAFGTSTPPAAGPSDANRDAIHLTPTEPHVPTDILRTPIPAFCKTPTNGAPNADYFSSRSPEKQSARDPVRTPRPTDFVEGAVLSKTVPIPHDSPRPGLYQQTSKSMVDLLSVARKREKQREMQVPEKRQSRAPDYSLATTRDVPQPAESSAQAGAPTPTLRRQRSLPTYNPASEPPPYPTFGAQRPLPPPIVPREEEGREQLPQYTNTIYLAAIMPRKVEFNAPGFQARDRKWKRALCILEGSMFKVYRVHNGVVEDWWERTVGVGDKTTIDPTTVGPSGGIRVGAIRDAERNGSDPVKPGDGAQGESSQSRAESPSASTSSSTSHSRSMFSSLLHPRHRHEKQNLHGNIGSRSGVSFDLSRGEEQTSPTSASRRQSIDSARSGPSPAASSSVLSSGRRGRLSSEDTSATTMYSGSLSRQSSGAVPSVKHFTNLSSCNHEPIPEPDFRNLVRNYSLQHAESGLASDYLKRKNVIRVRMEGEQFLLQAQDVPNVIEWIEGIQAATNISLDLDERPMPKGPMFPRRRRRRPRRPEGEAQGQGSATSRPGASS